MGLTDHLCSLPGEDSKLHRSSVNCVSVSSGSRLAARRSTPFSEGECIGGQSTLLPLLTSRSGFQTMSISEVFGEFRCGKTQLSHTMSVIAQLPKDMGGAEGKVAYIGRSSPFHMSCC